MSKEEEMKKEYKRFLVTEANKALDEGKTVEEISKDCYAKLLLSDVSANLVSEKSLEMDLTNEMDKWSERRRKWNMRTEETKDGIRVSINRVQKHETFEELVNAIKEAFDTVYGQEGYGEDMLTFVVDVKRGRDMITVLRKEGASNYLGGPANKGWGFFIYPDYIHIFYWR